MVNLWICIIANNGTYTCCILLMWSDVKFSLVFWHCRDVSQKQIEVETMSYALRIWVMRLGIWWSEPLRIILIDLLGCQEGGTIASMFIDKHGFWAHDNWENLLQDDKEAVEAPEESEYYLVCTHFQIETFYRPLISNNWYLGWHGCEIAGSGKPALFFVVFLWEALLVLLVKVPGPQRTSGIKISANKWEWKFSDRSQLGC